MGKAVWIIFVMGIVAVVLVTVGFLATMVLFTGSPAGSRARQAEALRSRFGFDAAGVTVMQEEGKKFLSVSYEIRRDSKADASRQGQEMKDVADFAATQYDEKDRNEIEEIRVTRTEILGRGCWQNRQVARETFPNRARKTVEPFRFDK